MAQYARDRAPSMRNSMQSECARSIILPLRAACRFVLVAAVVIGLSGCGGDTTVDQFSTLNLATYSIADEPTMVLAEDGTSQKVFSNISARRIDDSTIIVADQSSLELRLFTVTGRFMGILARRGDKPGELSQPFSMVTQHDTVYLFPKPPAISEVRTFTVHDGFLSEKRLQAGNAPGGLTALGRLSTGQLFVQKGRGFQILAVVPPPGTLTPDSVVYGFLPTGSDSSVTQVVWLPPILASLRVSYLWPNGPTPHALTPYLLGPTTVAVVSDDLLWFVDGGSGGVSAVDGNGRTVATQRTPLDSQPYDRALLQNMYASDLKKASRPRDSSRVRAMYDPALLPHSAPTFSAAYGGWHAELWARLFDLDVTAPQRFIIFDRSGSAIARATVPASLDIQQIGADFIIAVRRDSLGVESVAQYALRRQ
jgi:hypothetical protein